MKGDLCRQCRQGIVESKQGVYCRSCLAKIQRIGLNPKPAFKGHWYEHDKGGGR